MPSFGGKTVTNEEYLYLDAKNSKLSPPSAEAVEHARHEDTGCTWCEENDASHFRLQGERDRLESLRALYAVGIMRITQALEDWEGSAARRAQGLEALATPTAEERLELVTQALRSLGAKGRREWKK